MVLSPKIKLHLRKGKKFMQYYKKNRQL